MAIRRMLSKRIVDTDAFMDMPLSTQALYMHLILNADDEGFIGNPKRIMRTIGCSTDDMKILEGKRFVISFESGVIVVKHWKIHNLIRGDRFTKTTYNKEKSLLIEKDNKSYSLKQPSLGLNVDVIPNGNQMDTQVSIGKVSVVKDNKEKNTKKKRFTKPTLQQVEEYCLERKNNVDAEHFIDYYESNGWKVGRNPMKDWKATLRNWEKKEFNKPKTTSQHSDEMIKKREREVFGE